jgi:hypothetical protein
MEREQMEMEIMKRDLAERFRDWYKNNPGSNIGEIMRNIDLTGKKNGIFVYDDITIIIYTEWYPDSSVRWQTGRVYYTEDENNRIRPELKITFQDNNWKYTPDMGSIYAYNKNGYKIYSQESREAENIRLAYENRLAEEMNGQIGSMRTRSGLVYNSLNNSRPLYQRPKNSGGRKSRKSRKSQKNKKQKNRKTNRR